LTISFDNPKSNMVFHSSSQIVNHGLIKSSGRRVLLAAENSGANINIISLSDARILADNLKLSIKTCTSSKSIEFGKNGSNSIASQYIETSGAVGIIEDISENLFSVVLLYILINNDKKLK